ncbi:hypothetical protein CC86DRAFT_5803 [Ophiobolus disseminans]|uniref:Uncharacterized protein n=1 Tax=Ophiobolus disseminans TaxID=1469910 RepID=A0A6A7AIW7_9PLEO|nr:hypothetical protein CC86DRAFT_5803 [Ophiobolus disseminans]
MPLAASGALSARTRTRTWSLCLIKRTTPISTAVSTSKRFAVENLSKRPGRTVQIPFLEVTRLFSLLAVSCRARSVLTRGLETT